MVVMTHTSRRLADHLCAALTGARPSQFAPLTGLEVQELRVEGSVLLIKASLSVSRMGHSGQVPSCRPLLAVIGGLERGRGRLWTQRRTLGLVSGRGGQPWTLPAADQWPFRARRSI